MIVEISNYNFEESLSRIDQMLDFTVEGNNSSTSVPSLNEIPTKGGVVTNCSVIQVEVKASTTKDYGKLLTVYRAFFSEAIAIISSHPSCIDVQSLGTRLTAIVSTPFKKNIEALIDRAAMINTLAQVITRKASGMGLPEIAVRIGIDFGEAMLMRFGKYDPTELSPKAQAWIGNPVSMSSKLIETPNNNWNIWISGVVYNNLNDEYRKFFHHEIESSGYGADIINTYMKNWLNNQ